LQQHALMLLALFAYAFISNVALAVVPHEPMVVWYGPRAGIWVTALVATAGTVLAALVDHRLFLPLIQRLAARRRAAEPGAAPRGIFKAFARAPFAIIALSGLTPLPFFPFKAMAFTHGYPLGRYVAAVAAGRLPRYALLAWLGLVIHIPAWLLALVFVLLLIPSLRMLAWPRPNAN
jgi:membrane protein YqaA with SNARE-associated domain